MSTGNYESGSGIKGGVMTVKEATEILEKAVMKRKKSFEVRFGGMLKTRMDDKGLEHPMEYVTHYNCLNCSEDRTMCMFGKWVIPQEVTDYFPSRVDDEAIMEVDHFIDHVNSVRLLRAKKRAEQTGKEYVMPHLLEPVEFLGDFEAREDEKNRLSELRESLKRAGKWREFFEIHLDSAILDYRAELYRARREACSMWEVNLKTRDDGSKYREFIHHVCPMHSFYPARNQMLNLIRKEKCRFRNDECDCGTELEKRLDEFTRVFYLRPKWDPDFDIGDPHRGWTYENMLNIEHRVRARAKIIQRQNRFRTKPMSWETAMKAAWKEFFTNHPEYRAIRNWMRSVTIGKNTGIYGEIVPAKHPCGGAAENQGNALLVGVHAFTPRGVLITRKAGDKGGKSLKWEVILPSWKGEAADWNKLEEEERRGHLGCECCTECVFGDSIVLQEDEKGGKLLQFTEDILLDEDRFSKVSWMFAKFEEILSIRREVVVNGKKMRVPTQRQLIVEMTTLDKDVEDHFHQLSQKAR